MQPHQKKEKESVDLLKKGCVLKKKIYVVSHSTRWSFLSIYHIFKSCFSMRREPFEKKRSCSPPLRVRSAFQGPDIFSIKLQRVCFTVLTFHGFHLLRQKGANPLYPSKVNPIVICSSLGGNPSQYSNLYQKRGERDK